MKISIHFIIPFFALLGALPTFCAEKKLTAETLEVSNHERKTISFCHDSTRHYDYYDGESHESRTILTQQVDGSLALCNKRKTPTRRTLDIDSSNLKDYRTIPHYVPKWDPDYGSNQEKLGEDYNKEYVDGYSEPETILSPIIPTAPSPHTIVANAILATDARSHDRAPAEENRPIVPTPTTPQPSRLTRPSTIITALAVTAYVLWKAKPYIARAFKTITWK